MVQASLNYIASKIVNPHKTLILGSVFEVSKVLLSPQTKDVGTCQLGHHGGSWVLLG